MLRVCYQCVKLHLFRPKKFPGHRRHAYILCLQQKTKSCNTWRKGMRRALAPVHIDATTHTVPCNEARHELDTFDTSMQKHQTVSRGCPVRLSDLLINNNDLPQRATLTTWLMVIFRKDVVQPAMIGRHAACPDTYLSNPPI
jgi:hypothetical protein